MTISAAEGPYYFVLIQNGEPIGVAPERREEAVNNWQKLDPKTRQVVKLPELT